MKMLLALAAGAAGFFYYTGRNASRSKAEAKPELQRWEEEGGNVPSVATPQPAPPPKPAFNADPAVRH